MDSALLVPNPKVIPATLGDMAPRAITPMVTRLAQDMPVVRQHRRMKRAKMRLFIAAAAILCMALGAGAETLDCTHIVYEEDLSSLSLGRVTAGRRVNFVLGALERQGCPSDAPECRSPAFLLPGDEVVFDSGLTSAGLSCVTFVDRKGQETSGWLPTARIALTASAPNWIGRWKRNTSAEIDIAPKSSGKAEVNGSATWGSGAATHDGGILQ